MKKLIESFFNCCFKHTKLPGTDLMIHHLHELTGYTYEIIKEATSTDKVHIFAFNLEGCPTIYMQFTILDSGYISKCECIEKIEKLAA